jgi:amidase
MGISIASIRLVFKSILSIEPWQYDPECHNIPWRTEDEILITKEHPPTISFGLLESDGIANPHPLISRALRRVAETLKDAGHNVCSLPNG